MRAFVDFLVERFNTDADFMESLCPVLCNARDAAREATEALEAAQRAVRQDEQAVSVAATAGEDEAR